MASQKEKYTDLEAPPKKKVIASTHTHPHTHHSFYQTTATP